MDQKKHKENLLSYKGKGRNQIEGLHKENSQGRVQGLWKGKRENF